MISLVFIMKETSNSCVLKKLLNHFQVFRGFGAGGCSAHCNFDSQGAFPANLAISSTYRPVSIFRKASRVRWLRTTSRLASATVTVSAGSRLRQDLINFWRILTPSLRRWRTTWRTFSRLWRWQNRRWSSSAVDILVKKTLWWHLDNNDCKALDSPCNERSLWGI